MRTTSKVSRDTRSRCKVPVWSKELLAQLDTDTGVDRADNSVSKWYFSLQSSQLMPEVVRAIYLVSDRLDQPWKKMIFPLAMFFPRGEMTELAVVTVIGQPHLGSNEENLAIMNNDTAIVPDVLVDNRPRRNISKATRQPGKLARIPMSHMIPTVASDVNILASTSQE